MVNNNKRGTGRRAEKRLLCNDETRQSRTHHRRTAWEDLKTKRQKENFEKFSYEYLDSLKNKYIGDRVDFIEQKLKAARFRPIEEVTGVSIEWASNAEEPKKLRKGQRYYTKFADTMIVALQFGSNPLEAGMQISGAHIDSPAVRGRIAKLDQNYNLAHFLGTPYGGIEPKDYFNQPMTAHFHGVVKIRGQLQTVNYSWGDQPGEGKLFFSEESSHLADEEISTINQLEAIVGNIPHEDESYDKRRTIILNIMDKINKEWPGVNEDVLRKGDLWFVPSQKPEWVGMDNSMIAAYGQDNWASAYPLLRGFIDSPRPTFTKMAIFYDSEEIGDTGRGSLGTNIVNELIIPALPYLRGKDGSTEWAMLRNTWSILSDVTGAINKYGFEKHDMRDSPFIGSGVVLTPSSGEAKDYSGYRSSPEYTTALSNLFKENKIAHQLAIMGTYEERVGGPREHIHPSVSQGISLGPPILSMHRLNELTSSIDVYNMYRALRAFYSVKSHEDYLPKK